jgi:tRNA(Ile)-lysidine synthase
VIERVAQVIERHAMLAPGTRVGVAVSGGADSVCLLHLLADLVPRWSLTLAVLHVNHCLRGAASDGDEEFVQDLAARLGLACHVRRVDVGRLVAETGGNLEQAARGVRRDFFLGFLKRGELDRVALGHTQSDQAETVLFRFLRGSGTAGLAGMRPATPEGFVRPLLETSRDEVRRYLTGRGIAWREDASNAERIFARNRIRLDLLPALARDWNPVLSETLAAVAHVAAGEEDYWEAEVARVTAGQLVAQPPAMLFRAGWLRGLPRALARRVIRAAVRAAKGDLQAIDVMHVERILELTNSAEGSGRLQVPGLDVFRSFDWVRLAPPGADRLTDRDYEVPIKVPAELTLPHGAGALSLVVGEPDGIPKAPASVYNVDVTELDWGRISGSLCVRNWRPGDQYRPVGHSRDTKLKLLFQQARIPLWERRRWPVMIHRNSIVWAARFGAAADYAATPETRAVLKVRQLGHLTEF